jgi:hypothetical protein
VIIFLGVVGWVEREFVNNRGIVEEFSSVHFA